MQQTYSVGAMQGSTALFQLDAALPATCLTWSRPHRPEQQQQSPSCSESVMYSTTCDDTKPVVDYKAEAMALWWAAQHTFLHTTDLKLLAALKHREKMLKWEAEEEQDGR